METCETGAGLCVYFYYSTDAAAHPLTMDVIILRFTTLPSNPLAGLNRTARIAVVSRLCRVV